MLLPALYVLAGIVKPPTSNIVGSSAPTPKVVATPIGPASDIVCLSSLSLATCLLTASISSTLSACFAYCVKLSSIFSSVDIYSHGSKSVVLTSGIPASFEKYEPSIFSVL